MLAALEEPGDQRRGSLPPRVRARQGDARRGRCGVGIRALFRGQCAAANQPALSRGGNHPSRRPQHRSVHRRGICGAARRAPNSATRSSSSACRAPDRPWSSRSSLRIRWSKAPASLQDIPVLARAARRLSRTAYCELTPARRRALGEEYLKRSAVQRRTDRPIFIDKLPNNWMFVPFIQLILPNAKIIDARRHPLGCCLSNFRQHYARGQAFSYDLADMGAILPRLCPADGAHRCGAARTAFTA